MLSFASCHITDISFLTESLRFPICRIISSANTNFTSIVPVWMLFTSLCGLIALNRTSNTILDRKGDSGHPFLLSDLTKNTFNFSPLGSMLELGFSYMAYITLKYIPSIFGLLRVFIMKECRVLSIAFSSSIEMIM